uniref:RxLR effector candidate protein n=1 Tax=Hyaloperonospora arabidopsidis (strain Emoy2) TaxID=559515 RepID=M4B2U5_HYAAE
MANLWRRVLTNLKIKFQVWKRCVTTARRELGILSLWWKEPLQYVDVWGGPNAAAWNRLAVNGKVTQSYLELAHKDISELEMVSTLMTRHTKEAVASWIAAMKDLGGEEAGNVAARLEAA